MLRTLLVATLFLCALAGYAQPGSGGPTPGSGGSTPGSGGPTPDPTGAPIDGGVSLLLAGGAAYAVRHLRRRRLA
jgi:hypothetical protein